MSQNHIVGTYIESALLAVNEAYNANGDTITGLIQLKEKDPTEITKNFLVMFQALQKELRIAKKNLESAKDWNSGDIHKRESKEE